MNTQILNLFIVDDDKLLVSGLRIHLSKLFGYQINISTFYTGKSALSKLDKTTDIVILDYNLEGEDGNEILNAIKMKSPTTEVIMLSSNENMAIAIESFRKGASEYVFKGANSWSKIADLVERAIFFPVRVLVKELGVSRFVAMFILTFLAVGCVVLIVLGTIQ